MKERDQLLKKRLSLPKKIGIFFVALWLFATLPLLMVMMNPTPYVERFIPFDFVNSPKELYYVNMIDEGKEHNLLRIFQIGEEHTLVEEVLRNENWNILPLTEEMRLHPICKENFDGKMSEMLNCSYGYWRWIDGKYLLVYDSHTQKLYIRLSTIHRS